MPLLLLILLVMLFVGGRGLLGLEAEGLLSHEGRNAETRCMASRLPLRRRQGQGEITTERMKVGGAGQGKDRLFVLSW